VEDPSGQNGAPASSNRWREEQVSLIDFLLVLARNKRVITRTVVTVTVLGLTYALIASPEYTSNAKVVRESEEEAPSLSGGLSALQGLGVNLGSLTGSGLSREAYPNVVQSREVRLAVVRDTFSFPDVETPMTYVEYVNRPPGPLGLILKYTLKLPWTLKKAWMSRQAAPAGTTRVGEPVYPTMEEDRALRVISERVSASVDPESGLMTISVTAGGPALAANLADSFLQHLRTRIREIRTQKVQENLNFIRQRFTEAQQELETSEERLAQFLERNQRINSAQLQFQQDRLQRQVRFKEQLYSELQKQLTQTRLDLQRQQPVVTVVEQPVPPMRRSAPQRTIIVIVSLLFGGFLGVVFAFLRTFFKNHQDVAEEREKIDELREAFVPMKLLDRIRRESGSATE
jgi:uncharacterized protein involved in exopolysaccharide biosynthesis